MKLLLVPLAALVVLAGCAVDESGYPSLAKRPIEDRGFAEPAPAPAPTATPDLALDRQIAAIRTRLDAAADAFRTSSAKAAPLARAARNAKAGSDAWIAAQSALATLDDRRATTSGLVSEIDNLATARDAAALPDYPGLAQLRDAAQAETDREGAAIADLQAGLAAA